MNNIYTSDEDLDFDNIYHDCDTAENLFKKATTRVEEKATATKLVKTTQPMQKSTHANLITGGPN